MIAGDRIILTGFMGAGKSTVGPLAAELMEGHHFDTDTWMTQVTGIDVPGLVKADMAGFRAQEIKALGEILEQEPGVITTGGGIVSTEAGRRALLNCGVSIGWLQVPFEVAEARVLSDPGMERPLFSDRASAKVLFDERQGWYKETADLIFDASQPARQVAQEVAYFAIVG